MSSGGGRPPKKQGSNAAPVPDRAQKCALLKYQHIGRYIYHGCVTSSHCFPAGGRGVCDRFLRLPEWRNSSILKCSTLCSCRISAMAADSSFDNFFCCSLLLSDVTPSGVLMVRSLSITYPLAPVSGLFRLVRCFMGTIPVFRGTYVRKKSSSLKRTGASASGCFSRMIIFTHLPTAHSFKHLFIVQRRDLSYLRACWKHNNGSLWYLSFWSCWPTVAAWRCIGRKKKLRTSGRSPHHSAVNPDEHNCRLSRFLRRHCHGSDCTDRAGRNEPQCSERQLCPLPELYSGGAHKH